MDSELRIKDLKGFIKRRKKSFIITFSLIFLSAVGVAFILPPIYRSQAMILIEEQQIPEDYVKSTITGFVEERLQMTSQQVMIRDKLRAIIDKYGLYPEMKASNTEDEIIRKMRKDIKLETITADVINQRTGRPSSATLAFTLSYEGRDPVTVQKVAQELTNLYIEEDLKSREKLASVTTDFLEGEANSHKQQIQILENKISEFKKAHIGDLPENAAINLQTVGRLENDLERMNMEIRNLEERKIYLQGQIAGVDPLAPVITDEGKMAVNPAVRLKTLRLQLISLRSKLSDKHPDIKKLKREIADLEAQVGATDDVVFKAKRLKEMQEQLVDLKGRLGPRHPDVITLSREVDALSKEVDRLSSQRSATAIASEKPDNPTYISLMTQIVSTETSIKGFRQEIERIKESLNEYRRKLERAPTVEKEYKELTRDYESAKRKYDEIISKLLAARVAQGMETTQRGERFTVTERPALPEAPYKPNRLAIILLGFILGAGASVGLVSVQEAMDNSVKTTDALAGITGVPVFSVIGLVETAKEKRIRFIKTTLLCMVVLGVVGAILVIVRRFVVPIIA